MSLSTLMSRPCTIIRRTSDGDEDDFAPRGPVESYIDTVCEIQQAVRTEPMDAGNLSLTSWMVYMPVDTELDSSDALLIDGMGEFEVIGQPWRADTGSPAVHHLEATVRRTRGPEGS